MAVAKTLGGVSCAGVLLLAAGGARADEIESPRYHLVYEAPSGCPDRSAFVSGIRARTPKPRLVADDDREPAIMLRVAIESAPGGATGRLDLREPDGTEETRRVASATCAEVTDALALVAAVMLDPDARAGPAPVATAPPAAETVESSPSPLPTPPPVRPPPPVALPPTPKVDWAWSAGAEAGLMGGIGPSVGPFFGLLANVERRTRRLRSSVRLSFDSGAVSEDVQAGTQGYTWYAGSVRVCPVYFVLSPAFQVGPCAGMQVGVHEGNVVDLLNPSPNRDLWLAPVVEGSLDWQVARRVTLELHGGTVFPLRRTRFFLAPDTTIYTIPPVAGTAALAVRVRFL